MDLLEIKELMVVKDKEEIKVQLIIKEFMDNMDKATTTDKISMDKVNKSTNQC